MQHTTATRTSRAVAVALHVQSSTRRFAAASAEGHAGLITLHTGRLEALRREHAAIERRRAAEQQVRRFDAVRNALAAAALAA